MKAGRELDALVAEKVMGWKRRKKATDLCGSDFYDHGSELLIPLEGLRSLGVFKPSESIADAWLVVEKLGRWNGFEFMIQTQDPQYCVAKYEAGWYEPSYDGPESRAVWKSDSVPHAICLAALKAVGVEIESEGR